MIAFIVDATAMLGVMLSSFYVFAKSTRYNTNVSQKIMAIAWCLFCSILFAGLPPIVFPLFRPLVGATSIVFIFFVTKTKFETVTAAYLLSLGIGYVLYYIASVFLASAFAVLLGDNRTINAPVDPNQPIYLVLFTLIFALQLLLAFLLFRIRRFRKGFPFIFKKYTIVVALIFTGIVLSFVTWLNVIAGLEHEDIFVGYFYVVGVLIVGVGIYILVRRLIMRYQHKCVAENTERHYEQLYFTQKEEMEQIIENQLDDAEFIENIINTLITRSRKRSDIDIEALKELLVELEKIRVDVEYKDYSMV